MIETLAHGYSSESAYCLVIASQSIPTCEGFRWFSKILGGRVNPFMPGIYFTIVVLTFEKLLDKYLKEGC